MQIAPDNFLGTSHVRAMEEEVSKKVDLYVGMLQYSAEECEGEGVNNALVDFVLSFIEQYNFHAYSMKNIEIIDLFLKFKIIPLFSLGKMAVPKRILSPTQSYMSYGNVARRVYVFCIWFYIFRVSSHIQVDIEVKITAGNPMRKVSIQEVATSNATWVILDR